MKYLIATIGETLTYDGRSPNITLSFEIISVERNHRLHIEIE